MNLASPNYRILIVENEVENWLLLQRLLETVGFEVQVAGDGAQGLEKFQRWQLHFIWMDLRMPVMGGREATQRIRNLEGGRKVKIAVVTASAFASERDEVLTAGVDDFIRKPYRPGEIFDCLARHLGVRYLYGALPPAVANDRSASLRPEDLGALPEALRNELENAVISLDRGRIALVIEQISEQNVALGSVLTRLADVFAFTAIYRALESSKSRSTKTAI